MQAGLHHAVCSHKKQVFAQQGPDINQRETKLVCKEKMFILADTVFHLLMMLCFVIASID